MTATHIEPARRFDSGGELTRLTFEQAGALERFAELRAGAAFMEQGMGKSRVAVELANSREEDLDAVLWVCPFSVVATVRAETQKWGLRVPVRFIGYETLSQSDVKYLDVLGWMDGKRVLVVADESTFIKNAKSKRHQRMLELRSRATHALALNGTPLTRDPWDLKHQMDWLSPRILNMTDVTFRRKYFTARQRGGKRGEPLKTWWEVFEPNLPHLHSLMAPYVFEARLHLDVAESEETASHGTSSAVAAEYEEVKTEFLVAWDAWANETELYELLGRLHRIAALDPQKHRGVADAVRGRHAVVFCAYRGEQVGIEAALGGDCLVLNGDSSPEQRERVFEQFRVDRSRPLLLTYGVGAFGLNLQHCNEVHFATRIWDWGRMEQARSRVRRLGQEREIRYVTHESGLGIDQMVKRNLGVKSWLAELVRHEFDPSKVL